MAKGIFVAFIAALLAACDTGGNGVAATEGSAHNLESEAARPGSPVSGTTFAPDGVEIYYEVSGASSKPGAPTLVFIHGWSCSTEFWRDQLPVFAASHRVVALDLGGHGRSGTDRGVWSIAGYGEDVASVADTLKLKNIILVGHSMGGPVALAAAAKMPGKVRGVIGVDTLHDASLTYQPQQVGQMMAAFQNDFNAAMKGMFEGLAGPTVSMRLQEWIVAEGRKANPEVAVALLGDFARIKVPKLLAGAGAPVRVINAAPGPMTAETNVALNRQYADFDAIIVPDVGHFLQLEKPVLFNQELAQLLDTISSPG